jgi:virginiamycin B lyase
MNARPCESPNESFVKWRLCFGRLRSVSCFAATLIGLLFAGVACASGGQASHSRIVPGLLPFSQPVGITSGPDGHVWFALQYEGHEGIGRISSNGDVTVFRRGISRGYLPFDIASGPDGNLWFTESFAYPPQPGINVARITPNGLISEFPLATDNEQTAEIIAGPGRAMWIAELGANRLHRIDMAGNDTPVPLPRGVYPLSIVAWRGAVWISQRTGTDLWRVDRKLRLTKVSPPAGVAPSGLAAGRDGALWFSEADGRHIGRMTPQRKFSQFALPPRGGYAGALVCAPNGDMWFTEPPLAQIGRIDKHGVVKIYSEGISADSFPLYMTLGPDRHSMWFTETNLSNIGRITTDGIVTEFRSGQDRPFTPNMGRRSH